MTELLTMTDHRDVFIGEGTNQMVVRITIAYYPELVDKWMIDTALDEAAQKMGEFIRDSFNEMEKIKI